MKKEDADQLIRCVKECWWRVLVVIAAPLFLILALKNGLQIILTLKEGTAAWVQAIGSILAIIAAVALYFVGERDKKKSKEKEDEEHVTGVMAAVENIAFTLVDTMDRFYDKHYLYGVKGDLPRDQTWSDRTHQQAFNEVNGVQVDFEEFCETRASVIENCYKELSKIDWSIPPVSIVGIYLVSMMNNFSLFYNLLRSDVEGGEKRKELRIYALSVSRDVINAAEKLERIYGYKSNWPYIKTPLSWVTSGSRPQS